MGAGPVLMSLGTVLNIYGQVKQARDERKISQENTKKLEEQERQQREVNILEQRQFRQVIRQDLGYLQVSLSKVKGGTAEDLMENAISTAVFDFNTLKIVGENKAKGIQSDISLNQLIQKRRYSNQLLTAAGTLLSSGGSIGSQVAMGSKIGAFA